MILNNLKKNINNKKWFTLIELTVVISIIMIVTVSLFEPYNYYQKKIRIKLASKDVSQSLYDARNMAMNWFSSWINTSSGENSSVWLYLWSWSITFLSYPYTMSWTSITITPDSNIKIIKEIPLEQWLTIKGVWDKSNWLFFFNAVTWSWEFYSFDWTTRTNISDPKIKIDISYIWTNPSSDLNKSIFYYTKTNIVDDN